MKKIQFNMIVQLLFFVIILFSCKKDNVKSNIVASDYFPNKVGNYWEYDVYDSSQIRDHPDVPRQYTVTVTITGTRKLADSLDAMIWKYEYPWGNENYYYRIAGDSIKVYDEAATVGVAYIPYPNNLFITPFYDNQQWKSSLFWIDSFSVKKQSFLIYSDALLISREYIGQGSYYFNDYWFSEKIGFVKIHIFERNQGLTTNQLWQLHYYNLK